MSAGESKLPWVLGGLLVVSVTGMIVAGSRIFGFDPDRPSGPASALVDRPAPPLDLPVVAGAGAAEGDRVSLAALAGSVVVLDFWASWCGPCRQSIPALNTVHERYRGRIEMLGVNVEGGLPRSAIAEAHREFGARFPSLQDEGGAAQGAYRVDAIPTLVVIDHGGVVRWVHTGVPDPDELAERLEPLIAPRH